MKLYQEIVLLKHFCKSKWIVENVIPYYEPLVKPSAVRDRHFLWSNFFIDSAGRVAGSDEPIELVSSSSIRYGFNVNDLRDLSIRKVQVLRNCVDPALGLHIFKCAFKIRQEVLA